MRTIASATAQAKLLLCAFQTGDVVMLCAELDKVINGVECSSADPAEEERWELLSAVAGELRGGMFGTKQSIREADVCWSLLRHLASSKAPRSAVAVA